MIIYEVNLEVDADIAAEFSNWLKSHVEEMLTIDGFVEANIFEDTSKKFDDKFDRNTDSGAKKWVVHYKIKSDRHLQEYLVQHAGRMRAPAVRQFGAKFRANRRVLKETN